MRAVAWLVAAGLVAGSSLGCSSAVPTETPGVERLGAYVLRYQGPEVEAVLSYRFAAASIGGDWLLLDVAVTGANHDGVEVRRDRIVLRSPAQQDVPLAPQEEFAAAYAELVPVISRADVASDPLDYWVGRREEHLEFFSPPGAALVFPSFWVNDARVCSGRLFFRPDGGVQDGRYELRISLLESEVRIPFRLGGG
jgi:hypothetical protein